MTHYESKITPCMAWLEFDGYTKQFRDYIEEIVFGEYLVKCGIHCFKKHCPGNISEEVITEKTLDEIIKRENLKPNNYYDALWSAYGRKDLLVHNPFDYWAFDDPEVLVAQTLFKNLWDSCEVLLSSRQSRKTPQAEKDVFYIYPIIDNTVETIRQILSSLVS